MTEALKKVDVDKGPWFRARTNIGFGKLRPTVLAGNYFQLDDEKVAAKLLKDGNITKATEADAKKQKAVDKDAARGVDEALHWRPAPFFHDRLILAHTATGFSKSISWFCHFSINFGRLGRIALLFESSATFSSTSRSLKEMAVNPGGKNPEIRSVAPPQRSIRNPGVGRGPYEGLAGSRENTFSS